MCWVVENLVFEKLVVFLEENFDVLKKIIDKVILVVKVCEEVKKVREFVIKRKFVLDSLNLFGKFVDCLEKDFVKCEIFIVEGDFVGGFVK